MTALLIDLDGVLYEGDRPVDGAPEAVAWLVEQEIPHLYVTNTTSKPRRSIAAKLAGFGIRADEEAILTPPVAAAAWLDQNIEGPVALFVPPATHGEFARLSIAPAGAETAAAVVIGDYAGRWTYDELNRAFRLLMQDPQPPLIALGMTRYWQAEDGLRLDAAPFVVALAHASGAEPVVLGKPAEPFFAAALDRLGPDPKGAAMIGDDIRGDVGGAQNAGLCGVLVRTGKFRPGDLDGDIVPDVVLDSMAELPGSWDAIAARVESG